MGCSGSKEDAAAQAATEVKNDRRERQAEKRKKSQEQLRPAGDEAAQDKLIEGFQEEAANWPSRPPWYKKGKYQQGIGILIASPAGIKDTICNIVSRNDPKYSVEIGYGKDTKFDHNNLRFSITCSTVSMHHCKINFSTVNKRNIVMIEDLGSLNGTFVLGRPPATSSKRPMLEFEVRKIEMDLADIEYIRLGSACVLALDSTNIFGEDDDSDDDEAVDHDATGSEDLVPSMLEKGWYFPRPCPQKVIDITSKARQVAEGDEKKLGRSNSTTV